MKATDNSSQATLMVDEKAHTYVDPETGKTWSWYYETPQEQIDAEIMPLVEALVNKCDELALPVRVMIQVANTPSKEGMLSRGMLPGPRVGKTLQLVTAIFSDRRGSNPLIGLLGGMLGGR